MLARPRAAHRSYQQMTQPSQDAAGLAEFAAGGSQCRQAAAARGAEGVGRGARLCCVWSAAPDQVAVWMWTCNKTQGVSCLSP